jgi:hypothetical protein
MCVLGALLAAAQLLPTLELAPLSIRGEGVSWKDAVAGSLPSYLAVRALFPPFWVVVPNSEYFGYAGATATTLALLALVVGRWRAAVFGALICSIGLFLALGENNTYYEFLFNVVPGLDTFRVPARWLFIWIFGVAILAAVGADWIGRGAHLDLKRRDVWVRLGFVIILLIIGLRWQMTEGEEFVQRRTPAMWIALAAATLAIAALPHFGRARLAAGLLVLLTAGELWAAADASPARQAPPPVLRPGESVEWLRANSAPGERLLSLARPEYVPAVEPALRAELAGQSEGVVLSALVAQKWLDSLTPNLPMQFDLSTGDGYDGGVLPLMRWLMLTQLVVPDPRPDGVLLSRLQQVPEERILDLLGVRYVISNTQLSGRPDMQVINVGDLRLHAQREPVPHALVVFDAQAADDEAALEMMARPEFDPNRQIVVEPGAPTGTRSTQTPLTVVPSLVQPHRWQARVTLPEAGYLLQREAWYPGWRARVDGIDTPLVRADVLFRAVRLEPGEHTVEIYFQSDSFARGVVISLAALLLVAVLLVWRRGGTAERN